MQGRRYACILAAWVWLAAAPALAHGPKYGFSYYSGYYAPYRPYHAYHRPYCGPAFYPGPPRGYYPPPYALYPPPYAVYPPPAVGGFYSSPGFSFFYSR